jgi:hypothetical protein
MVAVQYMQALQRNVCTAQQSMLSAAARRFTQQLRRRLAIIQLGEPTLLITTAPNNKRLQNTHHLRQPVTACVAEMRQTLGRHQHSMTFNIQQTC